MKRRYGRLADHERLRALVSEGRSLDEIADEMGVTERTISRHKRALGLSAPKPPCRPAEDWLPEAERLLEEGYSQLAVSQVLGVGSSTVGKYFPGRGWTDKQKGAYAQEVHRLNQLAKFLHPQHHERTTHDHHSPSHNGHPHQTSLVARRSGSDCYQ